MPQHTRTIESTTRQRLPMHHGAKCKKRKKKKHRATRSCCFATTVCLQQPDPHMQNAEQGITAGTTKQVFTFFFFFVFGRKGTRHRLLASIAQKPLTCEAQSATVLGTSTSYVQRRMSVFRQTWDVSYTGNSPPLVSLPRYC